MDHSRTKKYMDTLALSSDLFFPVGMRPHYAPHTKRKGTCRMNRRLFLKTQRIPVITRLWLVSFLFLALIPWIAIANAAETFGDQLVRAASAGDLTRVKSLLDRGADVNVKDSRFEDTALMSAARWGHLNVVELPVGKDTNVNAKDKHDRTACELANQAGRCGIVQILGRQRADKDKVRYPDTPKGVVEAYAEAGFVKPITGSYEVKEQQRYIWDYFYAGTDSVSVITGYKVTKISENVQKAQIEVIYDDIGALCLQCPTELTLCEKHEKTVIYHLEKRKGVWKIRSPQESPWISAESAIRALQGYVPDEKLNEYIAEVKKYLSGNSETEERSK